MANQHYKYKLAKKVDETSGTMGSASFTPGTGAQYATPFAFKKTKSEPNLSRVIFYSKSDLLITLIVSFEVFSKSVAI